MAKADLTKFDYKKVAVLDCQIWQAYYSHRFIKFFALTIKLLRTQLKLGLFKTLRMAYHFAVASAEYRLNKNHLESNKTLRNLVKFYKIISDNSLRPFDFKLAAKLELDWWNVQRYEPENRKKLELGLANPFAVVYHVSNKDLLAYGKFRTDALYLKSEYFHRLKTQPKWDEVESLLIKSWQALYDNVQK